MRERVIEAPWQLGDSIYASYFLARYAELHPDEQVTVVVAELCWSVGLYHYVPGVHVVRKLIAGEQPDIKIDLDIAFGLDTSQYGGHKPFWHCISESLGVNTEDMLHPPIYLPQQRMHVRPHGPVLCAPYSVSCTSRPFKGQPPSATPNKMLSWEHWEAVRTLIEQWQPGAAYPLFVSGEDELLPESIPADEAMVGAGFHFLLYVLAGAKAVVAVDNGIVRLAALLNVPVFFTKPAGLGQMFIPTWGDKVVHEFGHPASYTVEQFRSHVAAFLQSL